MSTELRAYLLLLKRWFWLIILGAVLGGLAGLTLSQMSPPVYRASTSLVVRLDGGRNYSLDEGAQLTERITLVYAELLRKRTLLDEAIMSLGLDTTAESLARRVYATVSPNTMVLVLTVDDRDPDRAASIANMLAELLKRQDNSFLGARYAFARPSLSVIEPAIPPLSATRSSAFQGLILGLITGVLATTGAIVMIEFLDDRVRTSRRAEEATGLPTVAAIAYSGPYAPSQIFNHPETAEEAEAFTLIKARLQAHEGDTPLRTVLVSSSLPREGRSTVAANLAVALAYTGQRVVIVDSDLRRPALHRLFGLRDSQQPGLANLLESAYEDLIPLLVPTAIADLRLLPAGTSSRPPAELLASPRLGDLVAALHRQCDYVVLDSPATLAVADVAALSNIADGALLVINARTTRSGTLARARRRLEDFRTPLIGTVLLGVSREQSSIESLTYYRQTATQQATPKSRRPPPDATASRPEENKGALTTGD